eukprot:9468069-Pyramimonas_sp.AAC.1
MVCLTILWTLFKRASASMPAPVVGAAASDVPGAPAEDPAAVCPAGRASATLLPAGAVSTLLVAMPANVSSSSAGIRRGSSTAQ